MIMVHESQSVLQAYGIIVNLLISGTAGQALAYTVNIFRDGTKTVVCPGEWALDAKAPP